MSRAIEQSLKLVPVTKPKTANPNVQRRVRLTKAIKRQLALIDDYRAGNKTNRTWFWMDEDGQLFLQIKYGKNPLEMSKGKFAIACSSIDDVESNLKIVESLVIKGEFDSLLVTMSQDIRSKFKKP